MEEMNYRGSVAKILGMTDTGEKIPAAAGRISTQEGNAFDIYEKSQDTEKNAKLIAKVTRSGHNSTIEHTVFNIAFKDVSVFAEQFMIEFRLASFTVKSRRYVNFGDCGYYVPFLKNKELEDKYSEVMDYLFGEYNAFIEAEVPKEDARFLLPYCLRSNFFCTVNARELLHVLRSMLFGRGSAFKELYDLGTQLYEQIEKLVPGICADFYKRRPENSDKIALGYMFNNYESDSTDTGDKVQLISCSADAEKSVARSALIWTRQYTPDAVERIIEEEKNVDKIIDCVTASLRPRPLETINYTFRLNGVSLSTITHFARHRMHGLMVPCLTLTDRTKYIVPETVKSAGLLDRYIAAFAKMKELYDSLKAEGCSEEELVYCQMSGNTLDIVSSMNGRELLLFMKLRTCNRAQWEIRDYAIEMLRQLRAEAPAIFSKYGPSCYVSNCPEGGLSCGKAPEVKELFKHL